MSVTQKEASWMLWVLGIAGGLITIGISGCLALLFSVTTSTAILLEKVTKLEQASAQYVTIGYVQQRGEIRDEKFKAIAATQQVIADRVTKIEQKLGQ